MPKPILPALLLLTVALGAQTQDPPVFKAESNLVVLHVNVFDKRFIPVSTLAQENFTVLEDDRPQTLSFFSNEDVPVTVGLVIDNSSSMLTRRNMVVAGGMTFATTSHPEDELFIVSFTENVRLALPPTLPFTPNRSILEASLNRLTPGGQTALYDAVIRALEHIEQANHQKRVIIVLSDGDDTASTHERDDMYRRARDSDAIIYCIALKATGGESANPGVLKELARIGGGVAYMPDSENDVIRAFETIAKNIRDGYSLGYVPAETGRHREFHHVKVMVHAPGKGSFEVRYRHGYTTPAAVDAQ
jgi:Ca-activated chloride channel homolog